MKVTINKKSYQIPQKWDDMTTRQLSDCFKVIYNAKLSFEQKRIHITGILIKKRIAFFQKWEKDAGTDVYLQELTDVVNACTSWMFAIEKGKASIQGELTKAPFPVFSISRHKYYAPGEYLQNITVWEFANLETYYGRLAYPKRFYDALSNIIAILYRPHKAKIKSNIKKNYEGDIRQKLTGFEATIAKRAKRIDKLDVHKRQLILLYYETCREHILNALHPRLKSSNKEGVTAVSNINGWIQIILELSGGKFGDLEKTGQTPLFTIIEFLNMEQRKQTNAA